MGEHFRNLAWGSDSGPVFLGEEIARKKDHSEETARLIDQDIERILDKAYDRAKLALQEHAEAVHKVAEELLQHETILGQRVREILAETQKAPAPTTVAEG
jgi:cell division protease FtsH